MAYVAATPVPPQFLDSNGDPLSGGTIEFYVTGTSTPATVYSDSSGTSLGTSATLNSRGVPQTSGGTATNIFYDTTVTYKIRLKDSAGSYISPDTDPYNPNGTTIYASVAAMKADSIGAGAIVETSGYTSSGDGGGATYLIKTAAQATSDGDTIDEIGAGFTLANANKAILQAPNNMANAEQFGCVFDGVADIGPGVNACLSAGYGCILPDKSYSVATTINILDNSTILSLGSSGVPATSATEMFYANAVNDWSLLGFNTATGSSGAANTGETFLRVNGCRRYKIENWTAKDFNGWGFRFTSDSSTGERGEKAQIFGAAAYGCYIGWEFASGQNVEYLVLVGCNAVGNVTGAKKSAGNICWIGGNIVDNTTGVELYVGSNSNHGIWSGVNINHNSSYNLLANDVANGDHFHGCNWYSNGGTTSKIQLNNSRGVHIDGGMWSCPYECNTGSGTTNGLNVLRNMQIPVTSGGVSTLGGTDLANVRSYGHHDWSGDRADLLLTEPATAVTTFTNSWANTASRTPAAYLKDASGIVHLEGIIDSGTMTAAAFQLPVGYRPEFTKEIATTSGATGAFSQVIIDTSGYVYPQVGTNVKFSLDGISFLAKAP